MKLVLDAPAPPGITVEIAPLAPLPDDLRSWVANAMARDVPSGGSVQVHGERELRTTLGWPLRVVDADVLAGGVVVERRVGGFYELNEWAGQVLVRVRVGTEVPEGAIDGLLSSGRPMWRSREVIAALSELWS